jgi:GH25 family lysozyme M1 (1,4-beta-N-acetylmuramidase)
VTWGVDYAGVDGNKPPDLAAFKRAGGAFVWVRASFAYYDPGHKAWVLARDPVFARDWAAIGAAGLPRGAYMGPAIMASHSATEQVGVFYASVAAAGGLRPGIDFPPCLDIEFPQGIVGTGLNRAGVLKWIREAVAEMTRLFGVRPIIYTSGRVWNDVDADCLGGPPAPDLSDCPLWLARYAYATRRPAVIPPPDNLPAPPVPHPWGDEWHAHQDQGDAIGCPGFSATVDIDRMRPAAKRGDVGGHVAWYQRRRGLAPDGHFGPKTDADVRQFQRDRGLAETGEIDLQTFVVACWSGIWSIKVSGTVSV